MLHIVVPDLAHGGVVDYGTQITQHLDGREARIVRLSEGKAADWQVGAQDDVYLQFSGYGYARRGAPLWLLQCLRDRKRRARSLGVYFHELYAMAPPWRSSFWLSPVQRYIAASLARLSDYWVTNREGSARWLKRFTPGDRGTVLPICSTIGEPTSYSVQRKPWLVVFGTPGLREKAYASAGPQLFEFSAASSLQIHDIGAPIADARTRERLAEAGVIAHGRLPEAEITAILQSATFGLLEYPLAYVGKSSVFAALAANGVCPLLISGDEGAADGLVAGRQFEYWARANSAAGHAPQIGRSAWEWYQEHRVEVHVQHWLAKVGVAGRYCQGLEEAGEHARVGSMK